MWNYELETEDVPTGRSYLDYGVNNRAAGIWKDCDRDVRGVRSRTDVTAPRSFVAEATITWVLTYVYTSLENLAERRDLVS
jgi:hypothetical protein